MFSERLKERRVEIYMSQSELAEICGLHITQVSHFETGGRKPSFENLRQLAIGLNCSVDYLMDLSDDPGSYYSGLERVYTSHPL